jgi:hypothetical protein
VVRAGSNPAEAVGFFGRKNPQLAFNRGVGVQPSVLCRSFSACKNPYNYRGSRSCKLNSLGHFSPIVLPFPARGLSRHLCAERAWRRQVKPKAGWYNQRISCSAHGEETHRPYSKGRRICLYLQKLFLGRNFGTGGLAASNRYEDLSLNPSNKEEVFYNTNLDVAFLIPVLVCHLSTNLKVN